MEDKIEKFQIIPKEKSIKEIVEFIEQTNPVGYLIFAVNKDERGFTYQTYDNLTPETSTIIIESYIKSVKLIIEMTYKKDEVN